MSGVANALMAIGDLYGDVGDTSTALEYWIGPGHLSSWQTTSSGWGC